MDVENPEITVARRRQAARAERRRLSRRLDGLFGIRSMLMLAVPPAIVMLRCLVVGGLSPEDAGLLATAGLVWIGFWAGCVCGAGIVLKDDLDVLDRLR